MENTKTVWMVASSRGGTGKSLFCKGLAGNFEALGHPYAVIDGDGRTPDVFTAFHRKVPARKANFRALRPNHHDCEHDREYELLLSQLLRTSRHLIINTPDGADTLLLAWFDQTLRHTETNDIQFKFVYLLSDRTEGIEIIPDLINRFQYLYPICNPYFGDQAVFVQFNAYFRHRFRLMPTFPILRQHEVRLVFNQNTYPAEVIRMREGNHFYYPALTRARMARWQNKFNNVYSEIINQQPISNIVY